jgi:hypothetical protein
MPGGRRHRSRAPEAGGQLEQPPMIIDEVDHLNVALIAWKTSRTT